MRHGIAKGCSKTIRQKISSTIYVPAKLHGFVAFLFACYGAGKPAYDHFLTERNHDPLAIAEEAFVAALPQRLLAHPGGGALAVQVRVEQLR